MSLRYLPTFDENKNVIDPAFFEQGMADEAGEINGGLDRDNFPAADFATTEVTESDGRVFCDLEDGSYATDTDFVPDTDITTWQGGDDNDADGLGYVQWTAKQDAHYDITWNGRWYWTGAYSWIEAGSGTTTTDTFDTVRIRMTVDGIEIAVAGPFEDAGFRWATFLCGSIQLPAGTHTLRIECECVRRTINVYAESVSDICTNQPTFGSRTFTVLRRTR